jgi:hypothetical protein
MLLFNQSKKKTIPHISSIKTLHLPVRTGFTGSETVIANSLLLGFNTSTKQTSTNYDGRLLGY